MMRHKKKEHVEKVNTCCKYLNGSYKFGDLLCWFSHVGPISSSTFECNMCDKTFLIHPDYLRHIKMTHTTVVEYGETDCWYMHEKNKDETDEKNDKMQRLFHNMEKMTDIFFQLEQLNHNVSESNN